MSDTKPKDLRELFDFYYNDFKPLYCHLQSLNQPPLELLFEVNAAIDHLSRHWKYGDSLEDAIGQTCAHLKRASFDAYKIIIKNTVDHDDKLSDINTSIIDNGDFDRKRISLISEIKQGAAKARLAEGNSTESWHYAYDLWQQVYIKCVEYDANYYLSNKVEWAKLKNRKYSIKALIASFIMGVISSLIGSYIFQHCFS
ncbi:MAG: hypothetical protein HZA50_03370 [Planctomycetes bacterium]|nr:hypothetical protein [Planctomycetota bacterium]